MTVPARLDAARKPATRIRPVGATLAIAMPGAVNTISGTGGTVVTVIDHSADAAAAELDAGGPR